MKSIDSSGRHDTALDFRWNANRDPLQKLTIKTSFEPALLNPDDWNSVIQFSYPGIFFKGNFAALTQSG